MNKNKDTILISKRDFSKYIKRDRSSKIFRIWQMFLKKLPNNISSELSNLDFKLKEKGQYLIFSSRRVKGNSLQRLEELSPRLKLLTTDDD